MRKINYTSGRRIIVFLILLVQVCLIDCGIILGQEKPVLKDNKPALISIEQMVPGNIFYENEPKEFIIHTVADSIDWACYDFWNKKILSGKSAVAAGAVPLKLSPGLLGWFKLLIQARQNGIPMASKETSFAIVSDFDLGTVDQSAFIGQIHSWQSAEILIPIAKKMGVKYIRDAIRWDAVEKQKGVYKFGVKEDRFIALIALNNLKPYLVCGLYNPLYDNGQAPVTEAARLAFANYIKQLLARYPNVENIEIWNEPDIATFSKGLTTEDQKADFYFNLLKTAYEQVHPSFSRVKMVGMVVSDLATEQFLAKILQKGAVKLMDEYAFHSYISVPESIVLAISKQKNTLKLYDNGKSVPLNLSETGFTTFTFTEKEQGNNLPRRIVTALANDVQKVGIYNLQNKSTTHDPEGAFGLIRHPDDTLGAYTPKPAFATYAAITRQLSGASFIEQEQVSPGLIYAYKFKKAGTELRVMYSLSGTGVQLYPASASLDVVDMMGNCTTCKPVNGIVSLLLNADPVYVKGPLKAPFFKEFIPDSIGPLSLRYGFYLGGYSEFPAPDSISGMKWIPATPTVFGQDRKRTRVFAKPGPEAKAIWKAAIAIPGMYNVSVYLPGNATSTINSTRNALYSIYIGGSRVKTVQVDQFTNQGKWVDLGTYKFSRGDNNYVGLMDGNPDHDQPLRADVLTYKLID
jgi:hypothetical protein